MERIAGRYLLLKALARGGMGEIHLARQSGLDGFEKLVVIKRILPDLAANPEFVRLFLDEARVAADLRHPNVVSVLEVGSDAGQLFLAMDYVHGMTMRRVQRRAVEMRRGLAKAVVISAVLDIARGLHYAHRKTDLRGLALRIVHRDVSPQNVLIGFDGTSRLLDFGIARAENRREKTEPGLVVGKLDYMSPEQAAGGEMDARSDQYSLGILLWELTVGEQLFRGSDETVREAVRTATITRPTARVPSYPAELERIVLRALSFKPEDRFADCGEMLHDLEAFATKSGIGVSAERVATFLKEIFPDESDEGFVMQGVVLPDGDPLEGERTERDRGVVTRPERFEGNLPAEAGPLIGRAVDLRALAELLATSRLVTLHGPGGAGKTRLSLAYAHQHTRKEKEPVWFCDLSEARTTEGILAAVSTGLVIPPAEDAATVAKTLAARGKGLVVLDNAEQIVEAVASLVQRWMTEAPSIRFLVTSRETLRIPGEIAQELGPLAVPDESAEGADVGASDAVRLFVERARAVRSTPFSGADMADVARLVRALDGMPLAIELAAARMHVLAPRKLLERFDKQLDVLASGRRDAAGRQATLRGAIEWSWNLLDPHEREALAQVSVFRGGFSLEAAEAVLALGDGAPAAIDAVQSLREKSLVRALPAGSDGELRFGLYESIREFASERLAISGGREAAERRHAEHYVGAGRELSQRIDEGGVDARKQLAFEVDNLVAAHRRALAAPRAKDGAARALRACLCLEPIMSTRGPFRFFVRLVDEALAAHDADGRLPADTSSRFARSGSVDGADAETVCRAHLARGVVLRSQGTPARAKADLEKALAGATALGDEKLRGRALRALAYVAWDEGRTEESHAIYEQALAASRLAGDRSHVGRILLELGGFDHEAGRLPTAKEKYLAALDALRKCGDRRFEGVALGFLGCVQQELGGFADALENFDASIAIHRDGEDRRYEGIFAGYRGTLHHERGNAVAAAANYARAVASLNEVGDPRSASLFVGFRAVLDAEEGRFDAARGRLEDASDALTADTTLSPLVEGFRGLIDQLEGKPDSEKRRATVERFAGSSFDVRIVLRLFARPLSP